MTASTSLRIVIGVCVGPSNMFDTVCLPSIRRWAPETEIIALTNQTSIAAAYNTVLQQCRGRSDVDAVVLMHDDVELLDAAWLVNLAAALQRPNTAVVGVIGGRGSGGMAWFSKASKVGAVIEPDNAYDFGYQSENGDQVDVLDGLFMALSPWAIQHLRFDEDNYPPFHGYDTDICARAKAAGQNVVAANIAVKHHTSGAFGTPASYADWVRAQHTWTLLWASPNPLRRAVTNLRRWFVAVEIAVRPAMRSRRARLRRRRTASPQVVQQVSHAAEPISCVSVVIPALNAASTLQQQLLALDAQTYDQRFTVVVVDNGSTDATQSVVRDFAASHYDLRLVKENRRGVNLARNAGIRATPDVPGAMVLLADADDVVTPDWLRVMVNTLTPGTWVGGIQDYNTLNDPNTRQMWGVPEFSDYAEPMPFQDTGFGGNCGFYRSMWHHIGEFLDDLSGAGDENEFFYRAWQGGYTLKWAPAAVSQYRLRTGVRVMIRHRYRKGRSVEKMMATTGGRLGNPDSLCTITKAWAFVALGWPRALVDRGARFTWLRVVSFRAGQVAGRLDLLRAHHCRRIR